MPKGETEEMPEGTETWMPREVWDALVRGEGCPICEDLRSRETANRFGYLIADLHLSRLRLNTNQFPPGYCLISCTKHVREPYDLTEEEQALFFGDMMRAARALERVYQPTKMNFQLLGNAIPHLHGHIIPRYYGDPAPGRPIARGDPRVTLTPDEYHERVRLIREALDSMLPS